MVRSASRHMKLAKQASTRASRMEHLVHAQVLYMTTQDLIGDRELQQYVRCNVSKRLSDIETLKNKK